MYINMKLQSILFIIFICISAYSVQALRLNNAVKQEPVIVMGNPEIIYVDNVIVNDDVTLYDDLRFPANILKIQGASNIPEFTEFRHHTYELAFDATTDEQVFLSMQLPHARRTNSTLYPHFHWSPSTTDSGYVTWCAEWTCANVEALMPEPTIHCVNDTSSEIIYQHQMTPMIIFENNLSESAMCSFRLYRDAGADTYPADAWLLEFDIHYEIGKLGEDEEYT